MLILACQKCGELMVLAGSPDASGTARAMWTCSKCGAGQLLELTITKDTRRGDLRKIVGGMALAAKPGNKRYAFIKEGMPDEIKS
ncbi:alcohol dehydrogenase [Cloacibacillus porcorum]|uniref:alcohol dehydrogenase n=1 Tax=Cloacibacillus porcorum TaxID=1197717 RepID=UPI003F02F6A0